VLAALGAPALVQLGVPLLAAHLFIFYYGCISNVTPPVSLAAFAAAGISDSPAFRSAVAAAALAGAGFVVPFVFVYVPPLLLDGSVAEISLAVVTTLAGVVALASTAMNFARRKLGKVERLAMALSSLVLLWPNPEMAPAGIVMDLAGAAWMVFAFSRPPRDSHRPREIDEAEGRNQAMGENPGFTTS